MDYNKIGLFIMSKRKEKQLTQSKLAEKLFVSEKTISKWENGNGVPDTNSLPMLCEILEISINELLNGESLSNNNYTDMAEQKLFELQKRKEESDKLLFSTEIVLGIISTISFLLLLCISAYAIEEGFLTLPIIVIIVGFAVFFTGIHFCILIEQRVGFYVCKKCNHKYIPTLKQVYWAPHICRTRYMKCPLCKHKSWHKKVIK